MFLRKQDWCIIKLRNMLDYGKITISEWFEKYEYTKIIFLPSPLFSLLFPRKRESRNSILL